MLIIQICNYIIKICLLLVYITLKGEGYKVIRFWNNDINDNLEGIYIKLKKEIFR